MRISQLIGELRKTLKEHGDLEVYTSVDVSDDMNRTYYGTSFTSVTVQEDLFEHEKVVVIGSDA